MTQAHLTVNGERRPLPPLHPRARLLDVLRELGLTGPKEGCGEGECGACAVLCARPSARGAPALQAHPSCLILAPSIPGAEVWTVEGLARGGRLHPAQRALVAHAGSQCGYCTPGFAISLAAELYRPGRAPGSVDLEAIAGNLCRCTGYRPIRDALGALPPPAPDDPLLARAARPAPEPGAWADPARGLYRPDTLADALALLRTNPEARLVQGGTDVAVEVLRAPPPARLIALDGIAALREVELGSEHVRIGAGVPLEALGAQLGGAVPLLDQLLPQFASRLVRQRATLGGNLGSASPVGDGSVALLALDAQVELTSGRGRRKLPLGEFFTGYRRTARAPDELITAVHIPRPAPSLSRFYKVAKRRHDDISTVSAAFALWLDRDVVRDARLSFGGVAATPTRARAAEQALTGRRWAHGAVASAEAALERDLTPRDDLRGSARYRLAVARNLLRKLLYESPWAA